MHGPIDPETDEVRPRFRVRLVVSQGKNCRNRVFSGLLSPETEGGRLFCRARRRPWLSAGVLGRYRGIRGWKWVTTIHCWGVLRPRPLCSPSTPASPIAHPNGHPPVKRVSVGQKAPWGAMLPGSGKVCPIRVRRSPDSPPEPPVRARVASEPAKKEPI
jgi:hypothetical protein